MSEYEELFRNAAVETQIKLAKVLLKSLRQRAEKPVQNTSYSLDMDFIKGSATIGDFKFWDDKDTIKELIPALEKLLAVLKKED